MTDDVPARRSMFRRSPAAQGSPERSFALSSVVIFLIGIPILKFFLPAAIVLGFAIMLAIHFVRRKFPRPTPGSPGFCPPGRGSCSSFDAKDCTARPAISSSILGSPSIRAVVTHAHSDHACPGSRALPHRRARGDLLRERVGGARSRPPNYGERLTIGDTTRFPPSGRPHSRLGAGPHRASAAKSGWSPATTSSRRTRPARPSSRSAAIPSSPNRLSACRSSAGRRRATRSPRSTTGGAPIRRPGKTSVLFAYPLGKAQRVLAALDTSIGPIHAHDAVERYSRAYREQGVAIPPQRRRATGATADRRAAGVRAPRGRGVSTALRLGLDADPRTAPAAFARSRLRPLRPCRLARAAPRHRRHRRRDASG